MKFISDFRSSNPKQAVVANYTASCFDISLSVSLHTVKPCWHSWKVHEFGSIQRLWIMWIMKHRPKTVWTEVVLFNKPDLELCNWSHLPLNHADSSSFIIINAKVISLNYICAYYCANTTSKVVLRPSEAPRGPPHLAFKECRCSLAIIRIKIII